MDEEQQAKDHGQDPPISERVTPDSAEHARVVRREPLGSRPGQRTAIAALKPARSLLLSGLILTALACLLAGATWKTNSPPSTELIVRAAMVFPLGFAAWVFPRKPLIMGRWILHAALVMVAAFAVVYTFHGSMTPLPLRLLYAAWILYIFAQLLPRCDRKAAAALHEYEAAGGRIEDLYRTASPEDRRLLNPTALIISVLVLTLGAAGLWAIGNIFFAPNSRPSTIGIGGGR